MCCLCSGSPDTSGGFETDGDVEGQGGNDRVDKVGSDEDRMLPPATNGADTSSAIDLSDGSDIFALEIDVNIAGVDSSFAQSESAQMPSVGMSPNQESLPVREHATPDLTPPSHAASNPSLSPPLVYHPTFPEEFVPAPGVLLQRRGSNKGPFLFQIGHLLKVMPIPPVLKVPIYGPPPSPGETTMDGLTPLFIGEDSRVGIYAFYGMFGSFM